MVVTSGPTLATATFNAAIVTNGFDTAVFFRYAKVGSGFELTTGTIEISSTIPSSTVTVNVAGLDLSSNYSVTAYAFHTEGPFVAQEVSGGEVLFTTDPASTTPPSVITEPATLIGATTAELNAKVNPNGSATLAWFVYTGPNGQVTTAEQDIGSGSAFVDVVQTVTGLITSSVYSAIAFARNAAGQTGNGQPVLFTTGSIGSAPTISSVTVTEIAATQATLNATFDMGGLDGQLNFFIGTTASYEMPSLHLTTNAGQTDLFWPIGNLTAGTLYYLAGSVTNVLGESELIETTFTTAGAGNFPTGDTTLPDKITANFATLHALFDPNTETTHVTFDLWKDVPGDSSPTDITTLDASAASASATPVDFSVVATNLSLFTVYAYRATAVNASGSAVGQIVKFKTAGGPGGVVIPVTTTTPAANITENSATIAGTLDPQGVPTAYYFEFWVTGSNKKYTKAGFIDFGVDVPGSIGPSPESRFADLTGLLSNTSYNFRLAAVNAADPTIQYGTTRTFTTDVAGGTPPAVGHVTFANGVSAVAISARGTLVTNGADTDIVFQASLTANFAVIAATSSTETVVDPNNPAVIHSATLTGLSPSTAYYVRMNLTHAIGPIISYSNTFGPVSTNAIVLPSVTTNALSGATPTTMQASAAVTIPSQTDAGDTFAWFAYGTTSHASGVGYDVVSAEANLGQVAGVYSPTLQMGGPSSPPPLIPSTNYYCRAFARNNGGTTMGAEVGPTSTPGGGQVQTPVPHANAVRNITPYHFEMEGTLLTNGSATTVNFQYVLASDPAGWNSANVITRTAQVIADIDQVWKVADHSDFLSTVSGTWLWRIKAVNSTSVVVYDYSPTPVVCPAPVPNANFPAALAIYQAAQTATFIDMESARVRYYCKHNGQRMWMRFEYDTDPAVPIATCLKGPWHSYEGPDQSQIHWNEASTGLPPPQAEMRGAGYMTGLAANTTYYFRWRCWSIEGIHTSVISSLTTIAVGAKFAANWAAALGTRVTARGMIGAIPRDLRAGTGTRTVPNEVIWVDASGTLDYSAAEDAYTITVSPTKITVNYDGTHALDKTQNDQQSGTGPNLSYALRQSRVGDKIRMEGGHQMLAGRFTATTGALSIGDTVSGVTTFGTASQWTGMVHRYISGGNSHYHIRLLTGTLPTSAYTVSVAAGTTPYGSASFENIQRVVGGQLSGPILSGVTLYYSGDFVYECPDIGGKGGYHSAPSASIAYWGNTIRRFPITGVRVMPKTPTTQRFSLGPCNIGNADGGINGLFFYGVDITQLFANNRECWLVEGGAGAGGVGILGIKNATFKQYDPTGYGGNGIRQQFRAQAPITPDFRDIDFSPAQEHCCYIDSDGEINPSDVFKIRLRNTGRSADGLKTSGGRSLFQTDARGDWSQNTQSGPGYPPGRSNYYIKDCSYIGPNGDSASCSIYGYFGAIIIDGYTHTPTPTADGGQTRQSFVFQDDPGTTEKGRWLDEFGFQTTSVSLTNWTCNVSNEEDVFFKARGVRTLTIGAFTFGAVNNKTAFDLLAVGLNDNGLVTFTGAGSSPDALFQYSGWPTGGFSIGNRIHHTNTGITLSTEFQEYQDGKQFAAIF